MTPKSRRPAAAVLAALILLPWLLYAPAINGPFLFDDQTGVLELTAANIGPEGGKLVDLLGAGPLSYRPLRFLSFALDWKLGGGDPAMFHATNLLLHGMCSALLLWLLLRLRVGFAAAAAAALIFAIHPIQTEAVAYISGRKDLLCALFYLAALHSSLAASRSRAPVRRAAWGAAFFGAALLAFLAKEMALTLPAAVLLLDVAERGREPGSGALRRAWRALRGRPVFYLLIAGGGAAGLVQKLILAPGTKVPISGWTEPLRNIPLAIQTLSLHVRKMFWPWPQAADLRGLFPAAAADPGAGVGWSVFWNGGGAAATAAGLLLLGILILAVRRSQPPLRGAGAGGLVFFLAALLPVANLVRLNEPAAEHFLYIPAAGMALAFTAAAASAGDILGGRRRGEAAARCLAIAVLAALAAATFVRAGDWGDRSRLWSSAVDANPVGSRAWNNLGLAQLEKGDAAAAEKSFAAALRLEPGSARAAANLASRQRARGDLEAARGTLDAALAARPGDPLLLSLRGGVLLAAGRPAEAAADLEMVAELPGGPAAATPEWARDRGVARLRAGDAAGAAEVLREAARAEPADASVLTNLGAALLSLGEFDEAADVLSAAVALPGAGPSAHRNLAVARLRQGRAADARRHLDAARAMGDAIPAGLEAAVAAAEAAATR